MRARWYLIASAFGLAGLIAASALGTDYPHNETNPNFGTQFCGTCHILHNGFGTLLTPARGATVNQLCESCHYSGGPAPKVLTHGSVRGQPGCDFCMYTFEVACTNCHNPHQHQQPYENDPVPDGQPDAFIKAAIRPWTLTCIDADCDPGQHRRDIDNVCIANETCPTTCAGNEVCISNPAGDETICQCPIGFDGPAGCTGCDNDGNFTGPGCTPVACGTPPARCGYGTCTDGCEVENCPVGQHRDDSTGACTDDNGCVAGQCTPANGGACFESPIDGNSYCDCPIGTVGPDCSTCASGPSIGFDGANCTVDCTVLGAGADCGYGGTCAVTSDCPNVSCGLNQHRDDVTGLCVADTRCSGDPCTSANGGACLETANDLEAYCDCPIGTTGGNCGTCAAGFTGAGCTVDCTGRVGLACGHGGTCISGGGGSSNVFPTTNAVTGTVTGPTNAYADDGSPANVSSNTSSLTVAGFPTSTGTITDVTVWVKYKTSAPPGNDTYTFEAAIDGSTFSQVIVAPTNADQPTYTTASLSLGALSWAQVGTLAVRAQTQRNGGNDGYTVDWDVGYIVVTATGGGEVCNGSCDPGYTGTNCDQCDTGGGYVELNDGTCALADPCGAVTCVNGGTCFVDSSGVASCDCPGQFYDGTCSTCTAPDSLNCDGACATGYTGPNCDQCNTPTYVEANDGTCVLATAEPCDGVTCNNGGTCFDNTGTGECDCPNSWWGASCNTCGAAVTCVCDPGYAGPNCSLCDTAGGYVQLNDGTCGLDPCDGVTCSNGGTCYVDAGGLAACDCVGQYYDSTCSTCDISGPAPTDKPIVLATEGGTTDSFADGAGDDLGICEVCHTQTQHHRSPGANGPISHNVSAACTTCHIHSAADNPPPEQGGWGFLPSQGTQGCPACHLATSGAGTQDVDSWAWDGSKALIDIDEYERFGHGNFAQANYECGGGRAGFGDQGTAEGDAGCLYCHDRGVSHNTKGNYFRLRNWGTVNRTDGGPPQNDTCLTCHHSSDPDGFGPGEALDQVWQRDDSAGPPGWSDQTANFNNTNTADWVVFPAAEAIGDYAAFGKAGKFNGITIDNAGGTAGAGGAVSWQYWDGTAWAPLPDVGDATLGFTAGPSANQRVSWTVPTDWATTSLNGAGPYYYVRASITTVYTTQPVYDTGVDGNYNQIDGPDIDDGTGSTHPYHQGNKHNDPPEESGGEDPYLFTGKDNGGKFCWDCHDPHGDEPTGGGYYCKMIQRRPIVNTDPDGVPQLEADEIVFADNVAADLATLNCDDLRATNGLCRNCHSDDQRPLGMHYTKTLNDTHPESDYGGCATTTDNCTECHQHTTGFQGVFTGGTCYTCHMQGETSDNISYEIGDGPGQAKIAENEWLDTGHGRTTGTYGSGNPAANFNSQPDNGCYYCHDNSLYPGEHQKSRATSGNYFLLRNYNALNRGENDPANDTCLVCHDVDNATGGDAGGQYTEKCNPSTSPCATTTIGEAHWTTQHGGPGKSGGKLCWNCHDPHGDYDDQTPTPQPLDLMVQNRPWMDLQADDIPLNDPPTWSQLAATPIFQVSGGSDPSNVDFQDLTGNFTAGDAVCGNCHNPAIVDNCNQTTCPGHNLSTGKTKCTDCHKHTGEFEGEGQCVDCHNAAQPGSSPVRRPVIADFDSVQPSPNNTSQYIRSHHVGTGADIVTSDLGTETSFMGGQLTSNDCILCHAEGYLDTTDGVVKISQQYHFNNGGTRTIDLRDVDDPLPVPYTATSAVAVFPFDKSAIEARGLTYSLASWRASNSGWVTQTSTNLDPFCLTCHDYDGASAAYALGEHDGAPGSMGATLGSAGNPFNDGTITNEYDRTPRPSRAGAPDPAGSIVDIASKVAGAYSRHAIRGTLYPSFYGSYALGMRGAGAMVDTGITEPGTDPIPSGPQWNDASVMSCADCHTSDGSNTPGGLDLLGGTNTTLGNAHGADSEYMLRNSSRAAAEGFADKNGGDYVCYQCHAVATYNYASAAHTGSSNEWATADTVAEVGANRVASGSEGTIFGMLCFNCHGGSDWGNIHGTSEVFTIGAGPGTRNAYRFLNGASMRFYDPDGDGSSATANYNATQFSCYTVNADTTFGECTQHGGGFSKSWNRTVVRPLSY